MAKLCRVNRVRISFGSFTRGRRKGFLVFLLGRSQGIVTDSRLLEIIGLPFPLVGFMGILELEKP